MAEGLPSESNNRISEQIAVPMDTDDLRAIANLLGDIGSSLEEAMACGDDYGVEGDAGESSLIPANDWAEARPQPTKQTWLRSGTVTYENAKRWSVGLVFGISGRIDRGPRLDLAVGLEQKGQVTVTYVLEGVEHRLTSTYPFSDWHDATRQTMLTVTHPVSAKQPSSDGAVGAYKLALGMMSNFAADVLGDYSQNASQTVDQIEGDLAKFTEELRIAC